LHPSEEGDAGYRTRCRRPPQDRLPRSERAYHRIDESPGGLSVSPAEFRAHLDWIDGAGLPIVDIDAEIPPRGSTPSIVITFDDGYRSVADIAWPEIRSRGWPATLFVVTRTLEDPRPFSWDAKATRATARLIDRPMLTALVENGMTIGSHSCTHRYLPGLRSDDIKKELADSKRALEDLIGRAVTSLSYPMGGWNAKIRSLAAWAGYSAAVTFDRGRNVPGQDRLALRRQPAYRDLPTFALTVEGSYDFLRPFDRVKEALRQAAVSLPRPRDTS
jgi:peptidoglycan/xylan/chitin deacetylase (PgdA/CDA1 family)